MKFKDEFFIRAIFLFTTGVITLLLAMQLSELIIRLLLNPDRIMNASSSIGVIVGTVWGLWIYPKLGEYIINPIKSKEGYKEWKEKNGS